MKRTKKDGVIDPIYYDKRLAEICLNCKRSKPCVSHQECEEYKIKRLEIYAEMIHITKQTGFVKMAIERKAAKENG